MFLVSIGFASTGLAQSTYSVHYLVSDGVPAASHFDPYLVNAWGLARAPDGPWLVGATDSDYARFYGPTGVPMGNYLLVNGGPTGITWYGGSGFTISGAGVTMPSRFLFASEGGLISGWNPSAPFPLSQFAIVAVDNSANDAIYKGIAQAPTALGDRLYATDFHNAHVDVFDSSFNPVSPGGFIDPNLPAGYAPFGIKKIDTLIYVTYALQDALGEDEVAGPGLGIVSAFTVNGTFVKRIATGGPLNAPWGLALAPMIGFGRFNGMLLVANFGDGRILAFTRAPVQFRGFLGTKTGPLVIDGLWSIAFGNGGAAGPSNTLFFTAGPVDETHGVFGSITVDQPDDDDPDG